MQKCRDRKPLRLWVIVGCVVLMMSGAAAGAEEGNGSFLVESLPLETPDASEQVETASPDMGLHVEVIRPTALPETNGLSILIYHTHTWEAFTQTPENPYVETEKWRTRDNSANMVAAGDALAASLTALGFEVVHDTTAFEPPDLSSSYQRSLAMLEERCDAGETYDLYIDLHRDAFASANAVQRTVNIGGVETARFMVLIGKGEAYKEKPDWEANYALAQRITDSLNGQHEGLGRAIGLKTGRYNQHIAPCSVLIECGSNYNTLEEVLNGIPYLAHAILAALTEPGI